MPEDKYNFAPKDGKFEGVRTFSQQMTHIAAINYLVSAGALGEKNPRRGSAGAWRDNGPASDVRERSQCDIDSSTSGRRYSPALPASLGFFSPSAPADTR